jgi:hypothetical protein
MPIKNGQQGYDILDFKPSIRKSRTMAADDDSGTPRRVTRP